VRPARSLSLLLGGCCSGRPGSFSRVRRDVSVDTPPSMASPASPRFSEMGIVGPPCDMGLPRLPGLSLTTNPVVVSVEVIDIGADH
jgi:hypothetical protein